MKSDIIMIGSGGHAKVCIELLIAMGETVAFCIGDNDYPYPFCLNIPILKGDSHLSTLRAQGYHRVFVALGSNSLRHKLAQFAVSLGYTLVNAISPQAILSPSITLGVGIAIMAGAVINASTIIEDLVIINTGATIDHDCHIKYSAHIAPQCALAGTVTVGTQSFIGIGSKVIPNTFIGDYVTIGAGAVVIHPIPSNATAFGIPATLRSTCPETASTS